MDRRSIDPDTELLEALRQGETNAAERLVATFGDRAYRLAIGITGKQEAVQDAFWSVVRRIDTFRGGRSAGIMDLPNHGERRLPQAPQRRAS